MCKIRNIGDFEIRESYTKLCANEVLKDEFKIVKAKDLTHALEFLNVFRAEWIKIILIQVHDN